MFEFKKLKKNLKNKMTKITLILAIILISTLNFLGEIQAQPKKENSLIKLARVKYSGGSDWYNDPSAEVNLLNYIQKNTNIPVDAVYDFVDLASDNLFAYPIIFITGHGNMNLSATEVQNLQAYLQNGGFLYVDDDYGLDEFIRREMKKVLPDQQFVELPFSHEIFHIHFNFENGVPKIHEHDEKTPKTLGLFDKGRLCVIYTYESNPSDGWADKDVHNNPEETREAALQFGTNVVIWALRN
jgi:hypothetical protein